MRRIITKMSIVCLVIMLSACSGGSQSIKDRAGHDVNIPSSLDRIVSTSPATTEILVGLGLGAKIVAMDPYSKDVDGVNVDAQIINFINPDTETLLKIEPDIIITSSLNASGTTDPFALLKEAGIAVVTIPVSDSIDGIKQDIAFLGKIFKMDNEASKMNDVIDKEVAQIVKVAKTIPEDKRKNVYFEISSEPNLFAVGSGTFLNEFIEIIGANNIFSSQKGWPQPSIESIIKANPDVIITNVFDDPLATSKIMERTGFESINAVKNKQVYSIDTNISSRSSQHSIEALKQLAKLVYPEYYGN